MQEKLGASVLQGVDIIECSFLLADICVVYIYIYVMYLVYLTPIHVSGVQLLSGRKWIQKRVKGKGLSLQTVGIKLL